MNWLTILSSLKKGGSAIMSFIGVYKIVLLISGIIMAFIAIQQGRITYHKGQVIKQKDIVIKRDITIKSKEQEIIIIEMSNAAYKETYIRMSTANMECVLNNQANKANSDRAIIELGKSNEEINKRYADLALRKVDNVCANTIIGDKL